MNLRSTGGVRPSAEPDEYPRISDFMLEYPTSEQAMLAVRFRFPCGKSQGRVAALSRSSLPCGAVALFLLLANPLCIAQTSTPRAKYGPQAVRLTEDHAYLQKSPAVDYWRLAPYYLGQRDDRSCSLACVTMLVNFARAERKLSAEETLATQDDVFQLVDDATWRAGLAEDGPGVTLDKLSDLASSALSKYKVMKAKVAATHVATASQPELKKLREVLTANERSSDDLLIVNVLQSELTGDPQGAVGHFIPVAAYDAERDRVLLLDPDRRWYEPYWVSPETLLRAMATMDTDSRQPRGYLFIQFLPENHQP